MLRLAQRLLRDDPSGGKCKSRSSACGEGLRQRHRNRWKIDWQKWQAERKCRSFDFATDDEAVSGLAQDDTVLGSRIFNCNCKYRDSSLRSE